jgi:RNA polymerase sigma-70 factor, ECF subfamily
MGFNDELAQIYQDYAPRLLGALVSHLHQWDVAEEAMAEAFAKAAEQWVKDGVPEHPKAWLYRVAVHTVYDKQKHRQIQDKYLYEVSAAMLDTDNDSALLAPDQRLHMFFLCAHPSLSVDTQAVLILRYCALLPTEKIARAFLVDQDALSKRLQRAKNKLQESGIDYDLPDTSVWPERLQSVLAALEVLYDQSYADLLGGAEIEALARDAIQLTQCLVGLLPNEPEVKALLSLMLFSESRRPARVDSEGCMIPLDQQDTRLWNMDLIAQAAKQLKHSVTIKQPGPLQIRAAIHAAHAHKKETGMTVWKDIIHLYQSLLQFDNSALVHINLAMAYAQDHQTDQAWKIINALDANELKYLPAYHLAIADLYARDRQLAKAMDVIQHAITMTVGAAEGNYLRRRLEDWKRSS